MGNQSNFYCSSCYQNIILPTNKDGFTLGYCTRIHIGFWHVHTILENDDIVGGKSSLGLDGGRKLQLLKVTL